MTVGEIRSHIQPLIPADPFPPEDFDDWAQTYDQDVLGAEFPFDGYLQVLETTLRLAEVTPGQSVLDLGVGTGNLSLLFARIGCQIFGIDFSYRMLEYARHKLPQAGLFQADLRQTWPVELDQQFDRIVSSYVFHHFELALKVSLIVKFAKLLKPDGRILIADLAFTDQDAMRAVRQAVGTTWEEEYYWIADETLPELSQAGLPASFLSVSACAGIFVIPKP
jgi:putative AdoMet-dependent methyltransferase